MADFRPLLGLRYQEKVVGKIGNVLAPPYDVISIDDQRALYEQSPYNIVRIEYGLESETNDANRYLTAAATLAGWRREGVLASDARPAFYLYEQRFQHSGREFRRRSLIGRVRLEPWDAGVVLPHEHTMSGPKQDRLRLLRACRTDVSPVFALYRPDGGRAMTLTAAAIAQEPLVDAVDSAGQGHRLWLIDGEQACAAVSIHFAGLRLYIADGHHRYETALAYRDERKAAAVNWTGEEPENYVLMALTAADDPGLLILPIHRLVRPVRQPDDLAAALATRFDLTKVDTAGSALAGVQNLLAQIGVESGRRPSFGMLSPGQAPMQLSLREHEAVTSQMPAGHSEAWRQLGVNVLQYGVLEPLLGIDIETVRAGGQVEFTEDADQALEAVRSGQVPLAFLLNPTRPEEIFAVADATDRMPQKSTYFYPKLGTGLVLYSLGS